MIDFRSYVLGSSFLGNASGVSIRVDSNKRGFTLVELLVVISIIALLLSILMPSLTQARKQAKNLVCKNNLKNLSLGVTLYASDFEDSLPWQAGWTPGCAYSTLPDQYNNVANLWPTYLGSDTEIAFCPFLAGHAKYGSAPGVGNGIEEGYDSRDFTGYARMRYLGYNYLVMGVNGGQGTQKMSKYTSGGWPIFADRGFPKFALTGERTAKESGHLDREGFCEGLNSVYGDGHVEWHDRKDLLYMYNIYHYVPPTVKGHPWIAAWPYYDDR